MTKKLFLKFEKMFDHKTKVQILGQSQGNELLKAY